MSANTGFFALTTDQTLSSPGGWTTLGTISLTVRGSSSSLKAIVSGSGLFGGAGAYNAHFRILVDGVVQPFLASGGTPFAAAWAAGGATIFPIAKGARTIALQWTSDVGVHSILAGSFPNLYHANMYVEELPGSGPGTIAPDETAPVLAELATDVTISGGAAYSTLVSGTITTVAATAPLLVLASVAGQVFTLNGAPILRLKLDGTIIPNTGSSQMKSPGYAFWQTIVARPTVAAGSHTVLIEWTCDQGGGGTAQVAAASNAETHARILMQERA